MQSARFFKGCTLKTDSAPDWTRANSERVRYKGSNTQLSLSPAHPLSSSTCSVFVASLCCTAWPCGQKTEDDVLSVLLLPAIVEDTSVLAYAKSHGLVGDWPQFLARAARCLLLDPFKVR
jgi:hypothetical protein